MAEPLNFINCEKISHAYGMRQLLDQVSLGVAAGQRIGVVGRNGDGKTTLLRILGARLEPNAGRVSIARDALVGYLAQDEPLPENQSVEAVVLAGLAEHEWAGDARSRDVVETLLAGIDFAATIGHLSGGQRQRCALARLLLQPADVLLLDEPTNHLDMEMITWLADHLSQRGGALVVVTHDRWFLDAVCTHTWEVHDGVVDAYEGGYAAYVLAQAERQRQAAAQAARRANLVRKELAWLRRGAPARTAKPKFRVEAAQQLIEDVPPLRDSVELARLATSRLGKKVVELEDVSLQRGQRTILQEATWRIGPAQRIGIVGVNGAGKTSLLELIAKTLPPSSGTVVHGATVVLRHVTQRLRDLDPQARVLPTARSIRAHTETAEGEVSASALLQRFGFTGDRLHARVGDLSGGERRRLELLLLLLEEPNVLLLDEPTNDLDIPTLTVLEDYLDTWPGTLIVVSHDRYFLERVTDQIWALLGDGQVGMLPGGVEQFLQLRAQQVSTHTEPAAGPQLAPAPEHAAAAMPATAAPQAAQPDPGVSGAQRWEAQKTMARAEEQLDRLAAQIAELEEQMAAVATDYAALAELTPQLTELQARQAEVETQWLQAAELLAE